MSRSEAPHPGFSASFPALRNLLAIRPFRKLFIAGSLSSFGDWLALLATTALAAEMAQDGVGQYLAVSGSSSSASPPRSSSARSPASSPTASTGARR